ncbi:membrane protease YdiL (CAAX protease family) [Streptomonospora salina]|uniref:Membrane protease YdiL (CAAX protease family) n=1 Tax=Streptomonospora salina TaxID=104205 RepID=A0A841EGE9_9ACTN|nr:CPBP family intramembrane glutamic endopeptidase [Streptomonospora salina]MBB5999928.1 membrane protease YdiL (CAAX protease family) [Streptomonospora salina]
MPSNDNGTNTRRFGAHLSLSRWKPIIVIAIPPIAMIALQIALFQVAGLIDGSGGQSGKVTPLQLLAVNLSMSLTGLLTVPLIARLANVPWRAVLSYPRKFDRRRLTVYLLWALLFTVLGNAGLATFALDHTPWVGFGVTGTTIALLVVILLTTPFTAAAEELMFRGAMMPAVASWVRPERLALGAGAVVSSFVFAASHFASDPWLFGYHVFLGLATAVMAIRSQGLEAPIAFHVANNAFTAVLNVFLADGGAFSVERGSGSGGPHLFIPVVFVLATLVVVWVREGRARTASVNG